MHEITNEENKGKKIKRILYQESYSFADISQAPAEDHKNRVKWHIKMLVPDEIC